MSKKLRAYGFGLLSSSLLSIAGCTHCGWCHNQCESACQPACEPVCCEQSCEPCGCQTCGCHGCVDNLWMSTFGWMYHRSGSIPDTLPLGSTVRSWYQMHENNAEAYDFVIHQLEFVGQTAELTSDGKDHVLEIAARMPSQPFPVIIERTWNNADPELDAIRRQLISQILSDAGNQDADQRTVVAPAYGPGYKHQEGERVYRQHYRIGGNNNNGGGGGGFGGGGGGGFGGGGGGGGGGGFF